MRWLGLILFIVLLVLPISPVLADTSQDVTVTASGFVLDAPIGLTITYITDYEVQISWTPVAAACITEVRGAYGRAPTSRADGFLIYSGNGTSVPYFANFETLDEDFVVRAWSQDVNGVWSDYSQAVYRGDAMVLIGLCFLAAALTVAMFVTKYSMLGFPSALFWAILGGYAYTRSETTWGDWEYFLFFAAMGMTIFCMFAAYGLREKKDTIADEEMEEGDSKFIDEDNKKLDALFSTNADYEIAEPSKRTREIRERAERRRTRRIL